MARRTGWSRIAMSAFHSPDQGTKPRRVRRALSATPSIRAALFLVALLLLALVPAPQAEADSHPTGTVGRANLDGGGDPAGGVGSRWRRIGR
jgi:hypothetical protein